MKMIYLKTFESFSLNEGKNVVAPIVKVDNFFNVLASDLKMKYFPSVKYYRDDSDCTKVHYTIELFNNGVLGYSEMIKRLSKSCKDTPKNIHEIVSKYIQDFGSYEYNTPNE